tara:strand:- start:263 stop:544 length:282 start_codon:yes stop_codon:yes gene_type:complete
MRKELAKNLDKDFEREFGDSFINTEDMVKMCFETGLITPKTAGDYLMNKEYHNIKQSQESLPKPERLSNNAIRNNMAAKLNCSPGTIYNAVRD